MTNTSRLWKALTALLVVSYGILLYFGRAIYVAASAMPTAVKTTTGLTLLPYGLLQVHAAVAEGFWYARSAEFLQQPLMQLLVWLRMPGDIVFSVGVLMLCLFVARLWLGRGRRQEAVLPAGAEPATTAGR